MFNERMIRECAVDIGIVYGKEKNAKGKVIPVAREIDFIATSGGKTLCSPLQCAFCGTCLCEDRIEPVLRLLPHGKPCRSRTENQANRRRCLYAASSVYRQHSCTGGCRAGGVRREYMKKYCTPAWDFFPFSSAETILRSGESTFDDSEMDAEDLFDGD